MALAVIVKFKLTLTVSASATELGGLFRIFTNIAVKDLRK